MDGHQPGVKLYIDDNEIGPVTSRGARYLWRPLHDQAGRPDRYQPLEKHVLVTADHSLDLGALALKVLRGKVTVNPGTPGARVYLVSGTDRRELPSLPISVDIDTTKTWSLEASKAGLSDFKEVIGFDDGVAEKTFVVTLAPKEASDAHRGAARSSGSTRSSGTSSPSACSCTRTSTRASSSSGAGHGGGLLEHQLDSPLDVFSRRSFVGKHAPRPRIGKARDTYRKVHQRGSGPNQDRDRFRGRWGNQARRCEAELAESRATGTVGMGGASPMRTSWGGILAGGVRFRAEIPHSGRR